MKSILLTLIKIYQHTTLVRHHLMISIGIYPHACRHQPTCSRFAQQAIYQYGTIRGSFLALKRLLSCHSLSPISNHNSAHHDQRFI